MPSASSFLLELDYVSDLRLNVTCRSWYVSCRCHVLLLRMECFLNAAPVQINKTEAACSCIHSSVQSVEVVTMSCWRSSAGAAGRGTSRTLAPVWARRAAAARCRSNCYRKSPRSFYNDAFVWRWKTPSHTAYSEWHLCPLTRPDLPEGLCWPP